MKWWHWLILELVIVFGTFTWIFLFPSEIEYDLAKGLFGLTLIYAIEKYRETNRRKTMDYKKVMTCGECLKYEFCPVANHKACMKITTRENYTIEQNAGENQIESGVVGIGGSVKKTELKDQLESYEGYINDISLVIDPCKMCKIYKTKGGYDTGHFDSDGQWEEGVCKMCCWYYDSKFEVGD